MFRSNVSSKFLCFVGIVFDENTGMVSTRVNGNILGGCLFESVLTIWCSSLLEDASINILILSIILSR